MRFDRTRVYVVSDSVRIFIKVIDKTDRVSPEKTSLLCSNYVILQNQFH